MSLTIVSKVVAVFRKPKCYVVVQFKILDRIYVALGFLNDGETSVSGYEMLRRTDTGPGYPVLEDDWRYLCGHCDLFSEKLQLNLATNRRHPMDRRRISCLRRNSSSNRRIPRYWLLSLRWDNNSLVLRRIN